MNWEKLKSPTRATFKNPNFQSFYKLVEPKTNIQKSQFESNGELRKVCHNLSFTVENKDGDLHKIKLAIFQTKHHEWDTQFPWIFC